MKKLSYQFVFVACLILGWTLAQAAPRGDRGGRQLSTVLVGNQEVPNPGDPDGSGEARIWLHSGRNEIRYFISVQLIGPATAAHIHRGVEGEAGDVVVTLGPPTGGFVMGTVTVSPALIREIKRHPGNFYVNVHNAEYPDGALRGQLSKKRQ